MAEASDGVRDPSPRAQVRRASGEVEALRGELVTLVDELDRRRRELFDLRLQARRHPVVVAVAAGAAALLVGGLVARALRPRRERARSLDGRRRHGAARTLTGELLAAAGTAAGAALGRRLVERAAARRGRGTAS